MLKEELKDYLLHALDFPKEVHLESSSRCNSRCLTCPRDSIKRELGELSRELFVKAIEETAAYSLDYIMLHLNGEPLFLPIDELVWRINKTRELNPKTTEINLFTNGSLLDEERCEKLLGSRLDKIVISIDGGCEEDYEKIRRGLSWKVLLKNVSYLIGRKKKLGSKLTIMTAIVPQVANKDSVQRYFTLFNAIGVDHVGGSGVNNIGGLIDADSMKLSAQKNVKEDIDLPCQKIFMDLSIMSDGRACACSQDVLGSLIVGDLHTQSLKEIWQGKIMTEVREKFIYGKKNEVPFCDKCDYMVGAVPPEFWRVSKEEWIEVYEEVKNR